MKIVTGATLGPYEILSGLGADGQRFLIGTQVGDSTPVSVILNWTELLKQ